MKRSYIKPDAEFISFYSEEEITALDLNDYVDEGDPKVSGDYEYEDKGDWT